MPRQPKTPATYKEHNPMSENVEVVWMLCDGIERDSGGETTTDEEGAAIGNRLQRLASRYDASAHPGFDSLRRFWTAQTTERRNRKRKYGAKTALHVRRRSPLSRRLAKK